MENGEFEERAGETDTFTEEKRTPSPIDIPHNEMFHSSTGLPKTNVLSVFANDAFPLLAPLLTPSKTPSQRRQKQRVIISAKTLDICAGKLDIRTLIGHCGTGGFGGSL